MNSGEERIIKAAVSKDFFVEMLVRDIALEMAIHDLLDNCIDGALRLRGRGKNSFEGLEVDIKCSPDRFEISDNCGGIDADTARNYAFCFGRPKEAKSVSHSIGRFGVGMKRAVFKLGRYFTVKSISESDRFVVDVDIAAWQEDPEWQFEFKELEEYETKIPEEERGTSVVVNGLFEGVSQQFQLENFVSRLYREIAIRHQTHLNQGLIVRLNDRSIVGASVEFYEYEEQLNPGLRTDTYNGVVVRQIAGVGPRKPGDAGWYVFCNGRMVLRADQSEVTGWGEANIERRPKYHNDFAYFRGCVFFDSEDPADLPWNTTKDGVDQDSRLYRTVRTQMVTMMTPVLQFLREVASEEEPEEPLAGILRKASKISLTDLLQKTSDIPSSEEHSRTSFAYVKPTPELPMEERPTGISYSRPTGVVNKVKRRLGVTTNRAVGEKTFDYYLSMEVDE